MEKFNLNEEATIKLNGKGVLVYRNFYGKYKYSNDPTVNTSDIDARLFNIKDDGSLTLSLSELIDIFGSHMYIGNTNLPFVDMNIEINGQIFSMNTEVTVKLNDKGVLVYRSFYEKYKYSNDPTANKAIDAKLAKIKDDGSLTIPLLELMNIVGSNITKTDLNLFFADLNVEIKEKSLDAADKVKTL